jgi:16S rRNA processing protein RimM
MTGRVELGRVTGAFGIRGWIRLRSYTAPPDGILRYPRWLIAGQEWKVLEGHAQGETVVASLEGLSDRTAAGALRGAPIEVERAALPKTQRREFYWVDVVGGEVVSTSGARLGTLASVTSNGAQDVMVVEGDRQRLIPFVAGSIVKSVDRETRQIVVEWEPEY